VVVAVAEIRISQITGPAFYTVHQDIRREAYSEYWLKGGRGSAKSSFISLEIVQGIVRDPEANAIVYRKVADTLRDSVYEQIEWAINALELGPWFKCKVSPMEIIYMPTGQRIMFRGADDPGKSKSIKLKKGYFKYLWFEELTEFAGLDDIRTIKASIIRGGGHAFTFYSYNPPKSANNWTNAECLIPVPGRLVHHSDYTQVPPEWLGPSFLEAAEALKATNEKAYRHIYLGEITGTGGQVFDNLKIESIPEDLRKTFDRFYNGEDFGFAGDPDAVVRMHYSSKLRTLYFTGEVYGSGMNADVLAERVMALIGVEYITCDNEDPRMINELKRRGIRALPAKKGAGSVEHGMRWLQDLACIWIDPILCPNVAREYSGYEYKQDRFGNFLAEYPDKNNHTIDAGRYGVEPVSTGGKLGFAAAAPVRR
jgi:PBSX family phage terminase large subunit